MKKTFIILSLFFNCSAFSQSTDRKIFNDTSLYFIHQIDSLNPVILSQAELTVTEDHLIGAIFEFNRSQQRYADSVNPGKKKNRYQAQRINIDHYFFQLIPKINKEGHKEVWIDGTCRSWFKRGTGKKSIQDPNWKKNFISGHMVDDGGYCFIYLDINLTLKTHSSLTMNGEG